MAFVIGLIVLTSTVGIVNPLLIQAVFNKALFVRGGPKLGLLYVLVAIMAAVPVVNGAIGILQTYETTRVGPGRHAGPARPATTASTILANVVTFVSSIVAMIIISWPLTIVSVFTVPAFFWLTKNGRPAAPARVALHAGGASGDERAVRGNLVGVRGAAGQGVRESAA